MPQTERRRGSGGGLPLGSWQSTLPGIMENQMAQEEKIELIFFNMKENSFGTIIHAVPAFKVYARRKHEQG
jgi:hypothetical protein